MQTRDGEYWVFFASDAVSVQFDLYYTISSDNGLSWSSTYRHTYHLGMDIAPSIMQTSNGTIWLVWSSDRTGNQEIFYQTSIDNGYTWTPIVQLTNDPRSDSQPSIMQNLNGTIWITWHRVIAFGNYDILCRTSSDNGLSWCDEFYLVDDPQYDMGPSLTHTENGTVFVVWASLKTGAFDFELFYKTYNGSYWYDAIRLTNDPLYPDHSPAIIQDAGGTIWVFWEADRGGTYDIYYTTSSNYGASWTTDTSVVATAGEDQAPSITYSKYSANREIWVVFESTISDDFEIWYKISDPIPDIHDVAIKSLTPWTSRGNDPATWVPRGMPIYVNVTVENQGAFDETFNVTVYAERDSGDVHVDIGTENVSLTSGANTTLVFTWNTTHTEYGNYDLNANATILPLEYDFADNAMLKAARIGGIAVPWLEPKNNVFALLAPPAVAALTTTALGTAAIFLFKLLMSVRPRRLKRRSTGRENRDYKRKGASNLRHQANT